MELATIIVTAARAYTDEAPLLYFNVTTEQVVKNRSGGDTLAQFVVNELVETFDPDAGNDAQVAMAVTSMQKAADQLQEVANALSDLLRKREAA